MKTIAYFDCFSGISGDMIIGALLDAGLQLDLLRKELRRLNLTGYKISASKTARRHLAATRFEVVDEGQAVFRHLADLNAIIDASDFSSKIQDSAKEIFLIIALAESKIHGQPLEKVHFHEIGALDTIVDVVGALIGLEALDIDEVVASRLNVGTGFVSFSHGKYPVPVPATTEILKGLPIYSTESKAELVTPTGAAIIKHLSRDFGNVPEMRLQHIGYGAGSRDLEQPNVLRVLIGHTSATAGLERDSVAIIETNIDDMNPQIYAHVFEQLFAAGALDVYLTHIIMKKNRPGTKLTVILKPPDEQQISRILLEETTTLGLRVRHEQRTKLQRIIREVQTRLGKVGFKVARLEGETFSAAPEYEDCRRIAKEKAIPLKEVYRILGETPISTFLE